MTKAVHLGSGKVRDVYDLGDDPAVVATDRISAFDWVLPNGIPGQGPRPHADSRSSGSTSRDNTLIWTDTTCSRRTSATSRAARCW